MSWETNPWKPTEDGIILRNRKGITSKEQLDMAEFVVTQANMNKALYMLQVEEE